MSYHACKMDGNSWAKLWRYRTKLCKENVKYILFCIGNFVLKTGNKFLTILLLFGTSISLAAIRCCVSNSLEKISYLIQLIHEAVQSGSCRNTFWSPILVNAPGFIMLLEAKVRSRSPKFLKINTHTSTSTKMGFLTG